MNLNQRRLLTLAFLVVIPAIILLLIYVPQSSRYINYLVILSIALSFFFAPREKQFPKEILDNYPLINKRLRRRYVIFWLVGLVGTFALINVASVLSYQDVSFSMLATVLGIILIMFFIFIGLYGIGSLIISRYFILMGREHTDADERDVQNKNRAYKIAFQICLVGGLIFIYLLSELINYILPLSVTLPWGLLILAASTPTVVYAWLEPDPIPNEISSRGTI